MRIANLLFIALVLLPVITRAQAQSSVTKDPQAVNVLQQTLAAAGGATAIGAIKDYTGSGTLVFHQSENEVVQGTVTVSGRWLDQFRIDETMPSGVRSLAFNQGNITRKREDGTVSHFPPQGRVPSSDAFPWQAPMFADSIAFPYLQLITALSSPQFTLISKGQIAIAGKSAYDIQIQQVPPSSPDLGGFFAQYHAIDFFIDPATFQILMTQDMLPKNAIHQMWYSNYTPVSGVLAPFAISELMGGQKVRDIQLSQITFNSGLQDSSFTLQ